MASSKTRNLSPGKTMVTAKVATTDVLAARQRATKEGTNLSAVVQRFVHDYGAETPAKEPART